MDGGTDKQNAADTHSGILFSHKKERSSDTVTIVNLDNKEARHRRPHMAQLHSYETSRTGKSVETESRQGVARGWRRGEWGFF